MIPSIRPAESSRALPLRDRRLWLPLLLLMLLAAALRIVPLPHEALSGDEMFSRRIVMEPSLLAWHDVQQDLVHPPLYYMLLKLTTAVWGFSAVGIRMLSLICGLLTLPVLVILGNKLPRARWAGLLAAACVAVGRSDLFYSQEARSYAMYTLVVLLLALWVADLSDAARKVGYWVVGSGLMTVLVYTHYVGGVFVALAILGVLLSRLSGATKLRVLGCGLVAFFLFLPWLLGEVGVYRAKNGIGENLDWQGHPGFYDLRLVWATAIGVNDFRGGTLLALLLLVVLSGAVLFLFARRGKLRGNPLVLCLACMGWLTPLIVFLLSEPPANLPLFSLRHVLPATVLLLLLCAYGLELLAEDFGGLRTPVMLVGSACLMLLAAAPTLQQLHAGTSRLPYDRIEQAVLTKEESGLPAYAVWYYGIGEPVNYYCKRACVQEMPTADTALPNQLVLLYRPASKGEVGVYRRLLKDGYVEESKEYFTDGMHSSYGTTLSILERQSLTRAATDRTKPTLR